MAPQPEPGQQPEDTPEPTGEPTEAESETDTPEDTSVVLPEIQHILWLKPGPQLKKATLIVAFEGWNDAGSAATMAANHLSKHWNCKTVANIDPEQFYNFTSTRPIVRFDKQPKRTLKWPSNEFKVARLPHGRTDVILLIGVEPQLRWRTFCDQIIATAEVFNTDSVVTLGSLLAEVPHSRPVEVYGTADNKTLRTTYELSPSTYEGPTGIVGVLAAACREAGYPTVSFWSAVPSYTPGTPYPKAALALVNRAAAVVGTSMATVDLERTAFMYEREITQLMEKDEETSEYVKRLEQAWDDAKGSTLQISETDESEADANDPVLENDPTTLLTEVEEFLRDTEED